MSYEILRGDCLAVLRGGVWLYSCYGWTRVTADEPGRLESVLWLGARPGWHMEDHRRR